MNIEQNGRLNAKTVDTFTGAYSIAIGLNICYLPIIHSLYLTIPVALSTIK